jgi:hypothetical protein
MSLTCQITEHSNFKSYFSLKSQKNTSVLKPALNYANVVSKDSLKFNVSHISNVKAACAAAGLLCLRNSPF